MSSSSEEEQTLRHETGPAGKSNVHVIKSSKKQKRRIRCSRLISNKWFIIGVGALVLLIILSIVLGVTLRPKSPEVLGETIPLKWWQNSTFYRVYVTSFSDSNGDGFGDFKGIQERLSYFKELGVDVLWLSPIQDTNTVSGLDVTDFGKVKNEYGSLEDLRNLLAAAQAIGMKVIMDIILNQSGNAHSWFTQSKMKTEPFRDYYVWSPGKVINANEKPLPPNNWMSVYGGSAWQWNDYRQEYYLHQFWKNEPDLNYRSPQVIAEMRKAVNYWMDQGLDGFFVRDVSFLLEDSQLRDENQVSTSDEYSSLVHNYTRDLAESYQAVNDIFSSVAPKFGQDKILITEINNQLMSDEKWTQTFQLVTTNALYQLNPLFSGLDLKTAVLETLRVYNQTQVWPSWRLGDEYRSRIMTKYDQLSMGLQVVQLLLPGSSAIYFGEEIQMRDNPSIIYADTVDTVGQEAGPQNYSRVSRDPFRTPMRWNSSRHAGFSTAMIPWLPTNNNDPTVDLQKSRSNSIWFTVKELSSFRKSSQALSNGTIDFPFADNDIFSFTRVHSHDKIGYLLVWNVGNQRKTLTFSESNYIPDEMTLLRRIKPDGSRNETSTVRKNDVNVEAKELLLLSFWKRW